MLYRFAVQVAVTGTKRSRGRGGRESMEIIGRMSDFVGIDVDFVGFLQNIPLDIKGLDWYVYPLLLFVGKMDQK